ncbi:hypothetical protein H8356DRAFT_1279332 [Neocallimastix lanati (nom. inval.)]|uniref:Tryptophanyl-tRNA synthetase n=1 Tax=Neocallimastix californiae TaxID=1754190 RepID=A0A1Y2AEG4_9FUNG|nr:hypothetical protein H8356DRAFT_1279332 [Neocallimastix sp. JGI-2020a]ORY20968.1 hypothetical protein LY90DRAFT_524562 [Neocallimastix californiae]|eukprot:ORY20968.1 hypothetical protein LY90DRAFT_524562 [Neocallimastix californiae]
MHTGHLIPFIFSTFGFTDIDCINRVHFAFVEVAPAFSNSFLHIFGIRHDIPSLIPAAIDQDLYFILTRNVAKKLKYSKLCTIYSKFFPALQICISGGQTTTELQVKLGANLEVDVAC